jgi:hypothetical protein
MRVMLPSTAPQLQSPLLRRRHTFSLAVRRPVRAAMAMPGHGQELDDRFGGLQDGSGFMTIAGFGSLLSGAGPCVAPVSPTRGVERANLGLGPACRAQRPLHVPRAGQLPGRQGARAAARSTALAGGGSGWCACVRSSTQRGAASSASPGPERAPMLRGPPKVTGFRRIFAHTADVFHKRGIANTETVSARAGWHGGTGRGGAGVAQGARRAPGRALLPTARRLRLRLPHSDRGSPAAASPHPASPDSAPRPLACPRRSGRCPA